MHRQSWYFHARGDHNLPTPISIHVCAMSLCCIKQTRVMLIIMDERSVNCWCFATSMHSQVCIVGGARNTHAARCVNENTCKIRNRRRLMFNNYVFNKMVKIIATYLFFIMLNLKILKNINLTEISNCSHCSMISSIKTQVHIGHGFYPFPISHT